MRKPLSSLAGLALLTACGQVDRHDGTIEGRVKFIAQTANAVGLETIGAKGLKSLSAEGRTLVLQMDSSEAIEGPVSDAEMLKAIRSTACSNDGFRTLIDQGAAIRFLLATTSGENLQPITISYCPPKT